MKHILTLSLCFLALSFSVFGQENKQDTLIHLKNYSVVYSQNHLQPIEVWYKVSCPDAKSLPDSCRGFTQTLSKRHNIITSKSKHYKDNIYDRGHMAPSASLDCNCDDKKETFTYLNCALQNDSLNQKVWKYLEEKERDLAKDNNVFVYIKVEFENSDNIDGVRIPSGFYKTLIVDGESSSYYFGNKTPESNDIKYYKID